MHSVHVVTELHVTANHTKMLSAAQQCFYGKFTSAAAAMKITCASF